MPDSSRANEYYSDVIDAGGLHIAIANALTSIGSSLVATSLPDKMRFIAYGRVARGVRFSQTYMAAEERLFLFDFWRDGVHLANGRTPDLTEVATLIDLWVGKECDLSELRKQPCVSVDDNADAYDQGTEVEDRWTSYVNNIHESFPELQPFVKLAAQRPQLRQLFPYTSLNRFCFSRCTGYPFTQDTPFVHPQLDGTYNVVSATGKTIGNGDAEYAVETVIAYLPPGCGPAVGGTAETIEAT